VKDRDPVGELLGLVQVLGGEQHRRALPARNSRVQVMLTELWGAGQD
jgi:hypothetical protein